MKKFLRFTPIKLLTVLLVVLSCSSIENCNAQLASLPIPAKYLPSESVLTTYRQQELIAKRGAYDLTKSLPPGYVTDGSVDYTQNLQQGINKNTNIILPNFPVQINSAGLSLRSNTTVIFDEKSELVLMPNSDPGGQMLMLKNLENIKIYFPVLKGDREKHLGTKGEWGMGINLDGCLNVQIINPKVSDCWGDGMYFGKNSPAINRNIDILYAQMDHNRRNGISVICANGLKLISPVITNSNGILPMAGIDFEPNDNNDEINNIEIDNPITFNNSYGIAVALDRFAGKAIKNVNIKITNHLDDNSKNSMLFIFSQQASNSVYAGSILVDNPVWKNTQNGFAYEVKSARNGLKIKFSNIKMMKKDANGHEISDDEKLLSAKNIIKKELKADVK